MKKFILFLSISFCLSISSQINVVSDINQGTAGSFPKDFFEFKGELYFSALITEPFSNASEEYKRWKTDGTISGTTQLDNLPITNHFYPTENYIFYFDGQKIVKTDGTTTETVTINLDLLEYQVGAYGNYFYFTGQSDPQNNNDSALYKTDGTTTTLLMNFPSSEYLEASDNEKNIFKFNDSKIIIYLTTDSHGREPYITDGTPAGTMLLKNITQDDDDTPNTNFYQVNNFSIFSLDKKHLWSSDGTENGTIKIKEFTGASYKTIDFITPFNNKIYFGFDKELWETDGTESGTKLVFNNINSDGIIVGIAKRDTDLLILTQKGIHLFDGNSNTTTRLNTPNLALIKGGNQFLNTGSKVFFNAEEVGKDDRLWSTDGTENGTIPLNKFWPDNVVPLTFKTINDKLIFSSGSYSGANNIGELWVSDGTDVGTKLLKDINKTSNLSAYPRFHTLLNGKIYFVADDDMNGRELWRSDGTTTSLVKDIFPGIASGNPHDFYVLNDKIIFKAYSENEGLELWITDGTANGTQLLKDINPTGDGFQNDGRSYVRLGNFIEYKNELYFFADNGTNGMEIWKTDGTTSGTAMLKDINPGANSCWRQALDERPNLVISNNQLYFYVGISGTETNLNNRMWKTDGTFEGTVLATSINDIVTNGTISQVKSFTFNNNFYFYGREKATNKYELFRTDDANGIVKIPDTNVLLTTSFYPYIERIYFTKNDNLGAGNELWSIEKDDSFALYKDIISGSHSSNPTILFQHNNYFYFNILNTNFRSELWRSNETSEPEPVLSQISNEYLSNYNFTPFGNDLLITYTETENNVITQKMKLLNTDSKNLTDIYSLLIENNNTNPPSNTPGLTNYYSEVTNETYYFSGEIDNKGDELLSVNIGSILDIDKFNSKDGLKSITIYPNPVKNAFSIQFNSDFKNGEIYNISGRKVLNFSTNKVNVNHLNSGLYILKLEDKLGNFYSKKWIKK
ncbi:T9SS type A sorting domain-containing protein [Polaribacter sp.]|uniref:T9SS type A sorting domain-containing protein n=1 Tax=Polaribacter sp. TaxID=1920175 RepID=UPI003EF8ACE5